MAGGSNGSGRFLTVESRAEVGTLVKFSRNGAAGRTGAAHDIMVLMVEAYTPLYARKRS